MIRREMCDQKALENHIQIEMKHVLYCKCRYSQNLHLLSSDPYTYILTAIFSFRYVDLILLFVFFFSSVGKVIWIYGKCSANSSSLREYTSFLMLFKLLKILDEVSKASDNVPKAWDASEMDGSLQSQIWDTFLFSYSQNTFIHSNNVVCLGN